MSASTGSAARYALISGVNRAADPGLAALQSAESDAQALAAALAARECGFAVTTLIGADATADAVRRRVNDLLEQAERQPLDLLVAFCGHGVPVTLKQGGEETFLATHDFRRDHARRDPAAFLSLRWLYRQVYEAAEPRSVAIVLDCCFAGDIVHAGRDALTVDLRAAIEQYRNEGRAAPVPRDRLRAIIAATRPGEAAGETAAGGLLTQALLRVLRGEELIGDGEVTISQIDDWLKQQFADQATQKPYLLIEGDYRLTLADHRVRLEAQRTAAERQRRRDEALALIARWCSRDSLARAAELQTGFVGRVQELEDIRQHIAQLRPDGGYLLVTGVAGQGKSSILAQLLKDADPPIPAYFIRFTPSPAEQAALLGHLVAELLTLGGLEEEASTYLSDAANAITLRNSLVSLMERLSQERQLTLVIDGLDQIPVDYGIGQRDLSFLPERLPERVVVVIGTRPDDTLVPLKLLTPCREYQLPPLSLNDFAALLAQRGVTLSEGDRRALHAALHGNAFDLAFLAGELQREPGAADARALIRRVIANPKDIFTPTLERLRCDRLFWRDVLRPMLGVLLAAQEPLSKSGSAVCHSQPAFRRRWRRDHALARAARRARTEWQAALLPAAPEADRLPASQRLPRR